MKSLIGIAKERPLAEADLITDFPFGFPVGKVRGTVEFDSNESVLELCLSSPPSLLLAAIKSSLRKIYVQKEYFNKMLGIFYLQIFGIYGNTKSGQFISNVTVSLFLYLRTDIFGFGLRAIGRALTSKI